MPLARRIIVWIATQWARISVTILLLAIGVAAIGSIPQTRFTVEVGTEGGLFDAMGQALAEDLSHHGIKINIVHRADTMNIPYDIGNPTSGVDAGFVASVVPAKVSDSIRQLGSVMLAPVYLVTNNQSNIRSIADISGRRIGLYPRQSSAWAACDIVLRSYGINIDQEDVNFGNAITLLDRVIGGETEVACLIDVPPGSAITYAGDSLARFKNPQLRLLPIPEAEAISNKHDFLVPVSITAGSFNIFPNVKPIKDVKTSAGVITLIGRADLPPELVTIMAQSLRTAYSNGTLVNRPGVLPSLDFSTLAPFEKARDVYIKGLPWLYQNFSFRVAGFLDNFISTYGLFITILFLVLSITDNIGFAKPLSFVKKTKPARLKLMLEHLALKAEKGQGLSPRDMRRLAQVERNVRDESPSVAELESLIAHVRKSSERSP